VASGLSGGGDIKLWIGVTDGDWHALLASQPQLEEVNFWQPSGAHEFKVLKPGALFLFKLHRTASASCRA
jgi:putative restriction endonuclease